MDSKKQNEKDIVGPSEPSKRRNKPTGKVPRAPTVPHGQSHIYMELDR